MTNRGSSTGRPSEYRWSAAPVPTTRQRPALALDDGQLADAHSTLDAAVADAYGWPAGITDDRALRELLDLNRGR